MQSRNLTEALGIQISASRKRLGLSQEELAFSAGVHRTYVSMIERGCKSPTIATLRSLAQALDTPVWCLIRAAEESVSVPGGAEV